MSTMRRVCVQVIARKARIKSVALLNVLFYKWLGFPAGISGWHRAAVTTAVSPAHACLSMGASSQKSNVRCYPSPTRREAPSAPLGARRPSFSVADGKTLLVRLLYYGVLRLSRLHHDNHITNFLCIFALYSAGQNSAISVCKQGFQNKRLNDSLIDNEKALLLIVAK